MKLLLTLLLSTASLLTYAQKAERLAFSLLPVDSTTHLVTYTAVVPVEGASQEALYLRARKWATRSFVESQKDILLEDKDAGTLMYHGTIKKPIASISGDNGGTYGFVIGMYAKEACYKYIIDQLTYSYRAPSATVRFTTIYHDSPPEPVEKWGKSNRIATKYVTKHCSELEEHIQKLVADLGAAMQGHLVHSPDKY